MKEAEQVKCLAKGHREVCGVRSDGGETIQLSAPVFPLTTSQHHWTKDPLWNQTRTRPGLKQDWTRTLWRILCFHKRLNELWPHAADLPVNIQADVLSVSNFTVTVSGLNPCLTVKRFQVWFPNCGVYYHKKGKQWKRRYISHLLLCKHCSFPNLDLICTLNELENHHKTKKHKPKKYHICAESNFENLQTVHITFPCGFGWDCVLWWDVDWKIYKMLIIQVYTAVCHVNRKHWTWIKRGSMLFPHVDISWCCDNDNGDILCNPK